MREHTELKRLAGIEDELLGKVLIRSTPESPAEPITVRVIRPTIVIEPRTMDVRAGVFDFTEARLSVLDGASRLPLEILSVTSPRDGLVFETETAGASGVLRCRAEKATPAGRYLVKVQIRAQDIGVMETVAIIVAANSAPSTEELRRTWPAAP